MRMETAWVRSVVQAPCTISRTGSRRSVISRSHTAMRGNKRVWRGLWTSGSLTTDEITYWSVGGQKLGTYNITVLTGSGSTAPSLTLTQTGTNYYFGGKMIKNAGGYVGADR